MDSRSTKWREFLFQDMIVPDFLFDKNKDPRLTVEFNRKFFESHAEFTRIGDGSLGGKAQSLIGMKDILSQHFTSHTFPHISVSIPRMIVITTEIFDEFINLNRLYDVINSDLSDDRMAHAFQRADLPPRLVGDLYALMVKIRSPLAIRSSSLLEDALYEPFAGIYETKMTPNNQNSTEQRFQKLIEAIKLVYASTFFKRARDYIKVTSHQNEQEKMAVIIQEVIGGGHGDWFYPDISGVARSYNYYAIGKSKPEEGVVCLALGLGKVIVDEGISWNYSPAYPKISPPFNSIQDLMKQTQKHFWAVNMGRMPVYDPIKEIEFLSKLGLGIVEGDKVLNYISSTYHPESDKIYPGADSSGTKILNFAPILQLGLCPLNEAIRSLLSICQEVLNTPVEIEFAITLVPGKNLSARLGFLQVRPMVFSGEKIDIDESEMTGNGVFVSSNRVLGNGSIGNIYDIVVVKKHTFDLKYSGQIAMEVEKFNKKLTSANKTYILIGSGRWGSADPWLGIPIKWGQISGAKVIIETNLPDMSIDLSQGSHFFHNLNSFQISYFSINHSSKYNVDWAWLEQKPIKDESKFVSHIELSSPLQVKVDGRKGRGIILK